MKNLPSRYAAFPAHPLANVPQSTLDLARAVLAEAGQANDVDPEMADSIADAVVARLAEAGLLRTSASTYVKSVLDSIPQNIRVSAALSVERDGPPRGIVYVPHGTDPKITEQISARLPDTVEVRVEREARTTP